ncbi:MAG TPA: endolytic transglycosylase MltG [Trebonia sp.]
MRPQGAGPGTGPQRRARPGTGPMRPGAAPPGGRGPADYQPEQYSAGYDGGEGWSGEYGGDPGDSFVPGLGGQEGGFADPGEFEGTGEFGSPGEFEDKGWLGDSYDDGYDAPRGRNAGQGTQERRGGRAAKSGKNKSSRDDYDDYDSRDGVPVPKRKRGPVRRLAPWIALVVILAPIIGGGLYAYNLYMNKYHPADYSGPGTGPAVTVQVKQGDTASSLAPELAQLGVVKSSRAFVLAAEHSTNTAGLEPGTYKLNQHMQASLAYSALLNPKNRVQLTFTLREGQRAAQIIAALAKDMNVPVSQFESIVNNPSQLGLPSYARSSVPGVSSKVIGYKVEGFLWPATYNIQPHETPLKVLQTMVNQYKQVVQQQNLTAGAQARGLPLYAVLIEASMVQAEAGNKSQMPKIASVIKNRFAANMPLGFDSVLQYGQNSFALNIRDGQSSIPGPYNDFQNKTLPPTPISNPGLDAIDAVLHPATTNYLYFLAQPNGSSLFCVHQPASATATKCPPNG